MSRISAPVLRKYARTAAATSLSLPPYIAARQTRRCSAPGKREGVAVPGDAGDFPERRTTENDKQKNNADCRSRGACPARRQCVRGEPVARIDWRIHRRCDDHDARESRADRRPASQGARGERRDFAGRGAAERLRRKVRRRGTCRRDRAQNPWRQVRQE
ncbi:hypothetical protein ebA6967 [Aromatoleum aromaticum EbN1]|uniref:Uncharacterized protein n=1 Tax=Aromatoleum aromaticum (strain DSM 19018 / LMG 30748 / EbN1) TaxID=76114 RepID=Q5NXX2_AROAE|nr:hypothetical protein ebA6967 [Aromatoleum aromaticum EbN1]